jgi:hypothetical protein
MAEQAPWKAADHLRCKFWLVQTEEDGRRHTMFREIEVDLYLEYFVPSLNAEEHLVVDRDRNPSRRGCAGIDAKLPR